MTATDVAQSRPPSRSRLAGKRNMVVAGVLIAVILILLLALWLALNRAPASEWHAASTFSGGPCTSSATDCRTPAFSVTASRWKVVWDIEATGTSQIDLWITPADSAVPVEGGYVRSSLQGELSAPVGAGMWRVAFTVPLVGSIDGWTIRIMIQ